MTTALFRDFTPPFEALTQTRCAHHEPCLTVALRTLSPMCTLLCADLGTFRPTLTFLISNMLLRCFARTVLMIARGDNGPFLANPPRRLKVFVKRAALIASLAALPFFGRFHRL